MRSIVLAHRREPTGRTLARGWLLTMLTLAALAICCAPARAAGSVDVVRVTGSGPGGSADLSQLPGKTPFDVTGTSYSDVVTTVGGPPTSVTVTDGYSLATLFSSLGISPSSFTYIQVQDPNGQSLLLTGSQAAGSAAFPDGPAVVWQDAAGAHFLLPSLPGGGPAFAGQTFTAPSITIELHSGALLSIGISNTRAYVGRPVQFSAAVSGPSGGALIYQWSFGDGGTGATSPVSHTFTAPGTYDVYVKVTGGADSIGESSVLSLTVGQPPPAPPRPGGGTGTSGLGTGTGNGQGSGTGSGIGAGTGAIPAIPVTPPAPRPVRVTRPKPPTGPIVSGILVADVSSASSGGGHGAGSRAARGASARAAAALAEWFWIVLGVLLVVLGGAVLEWAGSPRLSVILGITPSVEAYSRER